jgi:hypothetical protein
MKIDPQAALAWAVLFGAHCTGPFPVMQRIALFLCMKK